MLDGSSRSAIACPPPHPPAPPDRRPTRTRLLIALRVIATHIQPRSKRDKNSTHTGGKKAMTVVMVVWSPLLCRYVSAGKTGLRSGNRNSAALRPVVFPSVPSDFTGAIIAGNRHYIGSRRSSIRTTSDFTGIIEGKRQCSIGAREGPLLLVLHFFAPPRRQRKRLMYIK